MVIADVALVFSLAAHVHWGWHLLAAALVFGALAWWVRRDLGTVSRPALLMITVAVQATGLLVFPLTSDDIYRYVWDGRVQLAGIDPYRFVPLDPALTLPARRPALPAGWAARDQPARGAHDLPAGGPGAVHRGGLPAARRRSVSPDSGWWPARPWWSPPRCSAATWVRGAVSRCSTGPTRWS